jgi:hypothetical protein
LEQFVVIQDSRDGDKIFQDDYGDKLWFKTCNENKLNMGSIICPSHGIMSKKEKRHVKNMIPFLVRKTSGGYVAHFPVSFVMWPFSDRPKHCNIVDLVSLIKL